MVTTLKEKSVPYYIMDNIFYRVLLNDRVKIEPRHLGKNFRDYITQRLKTTMEGVCTKHGFIKQGSIEVYKITPGNIELVGLNGSVVFEVYYYAEVCNPMIGNIIKAVVTNVNKFGILAEVSGILEIIIAKNSVSIQHDQGIMLEGIQIGQAIMVEVVGKKYELHDKKISIVGRVVAASEGPVSVVPKATSKKQAVHAVIDVKDDDDEAVDDEEGEEEENESEEEVEEEEEEEVEEVEPDDEEADVFAERPANEFFASDDEVDEGANAEYEFFSDNEEEFASDGEEEREEF